VDGACVASDTVQAIWQLGRRARPRFPEQLEAVVEISLSRGMLAPEIIDALADDAIDRARLPVNHPDIALVARAQGFEVYPVPGMTARGAHCTGRIYHRTYGNRRRVAWIVSHELAHGVLERAGLRHTHADVQALALALLLPRSMLRPLIDRLGADRAAAFVLRRHRFVLAWQIRFRVDLIRRAERAA
jgi:hypothetical protein